MKIIGCICKNTKKSTMNHCDNCTLTINECKKKMKLFNKVYIIGDE